MMLQHFLAGLGFGLVLQISVGPVCLAVLQKALNERWLHAWAMVWGVVLVDALYIALATAGVAALLQVPAMRAALGLGGALVLVCFGIRIWRAPVAHEAPAAAKPGLLPSFLYGVAVTLTNPLTVLFWGGVFGQWVAERGFASPAALVAYASGCVAATLGFLTAAVGLAGQARRAFSPPVRCWANRIAGGFLIAFAAKMALELWR